MAGAADRRQSRAVRILVRAAELRHGGPDRVRAVIADIERALDPAPILVIPALDRAFRDAALHHELGLAFLDIQPWQLERIERAGAGSGVLGLLSLVRDGHTRQAATERLAARPDRLSTGFLLNRLNDYVDIIGARAWAALQTRLTPRHAAAVVPCLPLIDRMAEWIRARAGQREQLREYVRGAAVRPVLWDSTKSRDPDLVRAACFTLAALYAGDPQIERVLAVALATRDPVARRWAARLAVDPVVAPIAVLQALAPALERDRSPAIRVAGVLARAAQGDRDGLVRLAFDPQGLVRHHTRVCLARSSGAADYRGHALATLAAADAGAAALIGALATLSDFGRREDLLAVAAHVADPRPKVAHEAARTRELLERLP